MTKKLFSFFPKKSDGTDVEQLLKEKQFFKSIVAHYPFAMLVQDTTGICRACNEKLEELFEVPSGEAVGRSITGMLPEELQKPLAALDKAVCEKKESRLAQQISFSNRTGKRITLSVSKVPMCTGQSVSAILTVFEDITARHAREEQSSHIRTLLQAILDHIPLGVYTRTASNNMTYFNKQSQVILGQMDPAYVNVPHAKQSQTLVDGYLSREQKVLQDGELKDYPEEIYVDAQGKEHILHLIKVPLLHAGPEPLVLTIVDDITQKQKQERELKTANAFLSAIIDNVPMGLYARTAEGKLLLSNKQSDEIFHDTEGDLDEKGLAKHESAQQKAEYLNREGELLRSGKILDIPEERYRTKDGQELILHMVKVPVPTFEGKPGFIITMVEDITRRKQQEKSLEEMHRFQQAILDNAPLGIYATSKDRVMAFANKKAYEMFPGESAVNEEGSPYDLREQQIFARGKILDIPEEEYVSQTGKKILIHLIKVPVFDKNNKPWMMLSIAEDITVRKQQEKEIIKAQEFLQKVVDNLPVALSVRKATGRYVLWNKRSEELFGVLAQDVIGKENYRADITREQAEFMLEADRKVFESRRELNIAQELISTPKEGVKIMHTVKTPLYTPAGEAEYLLNVSEDITAKTKMEKQIREAGEKNSLLVENAREGIAILENRKIIYANHAVCHLLGVTSQQELMGKRLSDFMVQDYQLFAKEKYEAVINELDGSAEPISLRFTKPSGGTADIELSALASKYLGRRIVIVFLRDMTAVNKTLREMRHEREKFKNAFEYTAMPSVILNHKGYIQVMNRAARELFHFTENDKHFYRNVYIRPLFNLKVRRELAQGHPVCMEYVFDFERAKEKFPGRVHGEGCLQLHLHFEPFNVRNTQAGQVEADYIISLSADAPCKKPSARPKTAETTAAKPTVQAVAKPATAVPVSSAKKTASAAPEEELIFGKTSQGFMNMLASVGLPAVILDVQGCVRYANPVFLSTTGYSFVQVKQQEFFGTFIRNAAASRQIFEQTKQNVSGNAFQVRLELKEADGHYTALKWDVFLMKDIQGKVEGYGLIGVRAT